MPAVSVVMAVHRVQPHLATAVESVCAQTLRDWELVLVDNGTGFGRRLLPPAAAADPRIRIVSHDENRGIAHGINAGVAAAAGEFVALLDHDDVALPERLERQVGLLQERPELGLVNCGAATIDEQGRRVGREFQLVDERSQRLFSAYHAGTIAPTYAGRRSVFLRNSHRPQFAWGSDFDFFARLVENTSVGGVEEVLFEYRRHRLQTTCLKRNEQLHEECAIRLITARRRAGRCEDIPSALESPPRADQRPMDICRHHAKLALRDGLVVPAVYNARRVVAEGRTGSAMLAATGVLIAACRRSPRAAIFLVRLFFTGPLRAHGLRAVNG